MKTYLVITILGQAIYSLGPIPDGQGVRECPTWAADIQERARNRSAEFSETEGRPVSRLDIEAKCVESETRPYTRP